MNTVVGEVREMMKNARDNGYHEVYTDDPWDVAIDILAYTDIEHSLADVARAVTQIQLGYRKQQ